MRVGLLGLTGLIVLAALGASPSIAHADDDGDWSFELSLRLGPALTMAPGADAELESGSGLEFGMGPQLVSPGGWGIGLDVAVGADLDGDAPSSFRVATDLYGLHRIELGESDWLTLRIGPSLWYADAGMSSSECEDGECPAEIMARMDMLDEHDSAVLGGMAAVGLSRAFGPFMLGAELRGRVGYAFRDELAPVRAHVALVLQWTMRLPPKTDF
jgi:hypothetical protein